jgi:hypothetical protein
MSVAAGQTQLFKARRWRVPVPLLAFAAIVLAVHVQPAGAVILPASTIDGLQEI